MTERTAIIVGGGIGGLCAGLALRQAGFAVEVYEGARELREVGAGLSLWPNALRALDRLGVGTATRALGVADLAGGGIYDNSGRPLMTVAMDEIARRFGAPTVVVHRADFQALLADTLGRDLIQTGARCTGFDAEPGGGVRAHFADGREARGDLLLGADGIRSAVRAQFLPAIRPRYAGYTAWRAVVPYDHALVGRWGETWGPGARFGVAPVGGGRVYWFATINAPAGTPARAGRHPAARKATVLARFREFAAPVPALIAATPDALILPGDIEELSPLPRWGVGPVTLLGDAAHAMTPNLGQGGGQAIEDAVVLGARLRNTAPNAAAIEDALRAYEAARRGRTRTIQRLSRVVGTVGQWRSPAACALRDGLVRLVPAGARLDRLAPILGHEAR